MGRVVTNPTGSVVDASEVKILYESNENTNAYTDGDKASLGEVKDAIDMAKKVIEITFLLNDWTSNSDGTYSQTVNNSEIKSSMNPDLISMLSSGAIPEEQKTYMKNFSILCQGVGNTANGSVTYKIYKQMTGDITVGLTRLGGVKQIESGAKVDDVKVDGVSVVKDKVAEIPAIPTNLDFVPYKNAQRDIELGDKILSAGISITEDGVTTGYNTSLYPQSISVGASIKKSGELFPSDEKNVELKPDGMIFTGNTPNSSSITVTPEYSKDEDFDHLAFIVKNYKLQQGFAKLKVGEPTEDSQAATKKYVDESIAAIPKSNIIINRISLDGIRGDKTINLGSTGTGSTRELLLMISADSPLPMDKYIGSVLTVIPNGEPVPRMGANVDTQPATITTDSLNSETFLYALSIQFHVTAKTINADGSDGDWMHALNTASLSISIITDGVVVSLDKTKSELIEQT